MGPVMQGLLELNLLFLAAGLALLWGLRGWQTWLDLLETVGIAFLLGVTASVLLATLVLILGGSLSTAVVLAVCGNVLLAGVVLGIVCRRPLPRTLGELPGMSLATIAAALLSVVSAGILVAFFRLARIMPLGGADSWQFWLPKSRAIFYFGGIDGAFFKTIARPSYPLLVPALQAMDFRLIGSADGPAVAVQYWFLLAGFILAAAALLRRLVPAWLGWLFLALVLVIPQLDQRLLNAQADWTLDLLFVGSALFAICWLRTPEMWLLACYGVMAAGTIATKREGTLFAVCLAAGIVLATLRSWRMWLPIVGVTAAAYALSIPWLLWWTSRHLVSDNPHEQASGLVTPDGHLWPALHLALRIVFSYDFWLVFVPLAIVAALAALTGGGFGRKLAVIYLSTGLLLVAGFTWILWIFGGTLDEQFQSTPIPRAAGSLALLSTVLAPLLIAPLLWPDRYAAPPPAS
jgi:hypothetical protein